MGKNVFEEIGSASTKIAIAFTRDQELCRLLKYTDKQPLSKEKPDWDQINNPLLHKNILIIPKVDCEELTDSKIVINIPYSSQDDDNDDFANVTIYIDIFTKMDQWIIEEEHDMLRPFKIMSIIKNILDGKRMTSIGTINYSNFELEVLDNDVACHHMVFYTSAND